MDFPRRGSLVLCETLTISGRVSVQYLFMFGTRPIKEEHMKALNALAAALVIVGGLNWGLVALAEFDLVAWLVGEDFGQTNRRQSHRLRARRPRRRLRHRADREQGNHHERSSLRLESGMKGTPMRKLILPIVVLVVALATAAVALGGDDRSGSTAQPAVKPAKKNIVQTAVGGGRLRHARLAGQARRAGQDAVGQGPVHGLRTDRRGLRQGAEGHARAARPRQGGAALGAAATTSPRAG